MTDLFKINFKDEDVIKIQNKIKEFNWLKISSSKACGGKSFSIVELMIYLYD